MRAHDAGSGRRAADEPSRRSRRSGAGSLRVAIATSAASGGSQVDDVMLADALTERGATVEIVDWRSSGQLGSYDIIVVRSTWDYQDHHAEFLQWIDDVASQSLLLNPAAVMKANTVKTYLRVLERHDVPVVPTWWITHHDLDDLPPGHDLVVKPSVGATGSGLRRFTSRDGIREHVESLLHLGEVMIQPFLPAVARIGETSLVFIGGRFTHAVQKVAKQGEFRVQSEFGGSYSLVTPRPETLTVAERALAVIAADQAGLAYARVDVVEDEAGSPLVGEVELVEPDLFLALNPDAARQLADYIVSARHDGT